MLKSQVSKFKLKNGGKPESYRGIDDLSPDVLKMLSSLNDNGKKPKNSKVSSKKIALSDKEFGKY